jgi:ubiquinone/menaquinone biosynthesis C-methylase UbiE
MAGSIFERTHPDDYLSRLATSELGRSYKALAVDKLEVNDRDVVVDLGCGPGADLPAFAAAVGADGRVIGLDRDRDNVHQATKRAAQLPQVVVRQGDVHTLDQAAGSVDRVYADRVLQHVADPGRVLGEALRVLKPAGRAVFAEPDWDTLVIDYPDLAVARAYTRFVADRVIPNACIGRQTSGLAVGVGFTVNEVVPITAVFREVDAADKVLGLRRVTERAVAARYMTAQDAERWLAHLATRPFFASATLFVVVANKPPVAR